MAKVAEAPVKRGPGRPKGSVNKPNGVVKRGPGRPKKVVDEGEETPKKKGPGRPKGSGKKNIDETVASKSPGRPPKVSSTKRSELIEALIGSEDVTTFSNSLPKSVQDAIVTVNRFAAGLEV